MKLSVMEILELNLEQGKVRPKYQPGLKMKLNQFECRVMKVRGYARVEEGKKQKREKQKGKKDKGGALNFSSSKGEVENLEVESATGSGLQKEIEKELRNSVEGENGGLVDPQDLQIKKKNHGAATENQLYAAELKMVQKKKRKIDLVISLIRE